MKYLEIGTITHREKIHSDLFQLHFHSPAIARDSQPGQFLHIRVGNGIDPLLRRPVSIQRVFDDTIEILIKVYGRGSDKLCALTVGDQIDCLGPVGSTWKTPEGHTSVVGVSGGVGIAPIIFQQDRWSSTIPYYHLLGSRSKADLPISDELMTRYQPDIATDDGSSGFHGNVVSLVDKRFCEGGLGSNPFFITCGPWIMMKALRDWLRSHHLRGQFSAEARMGCAVGVCQGCAVAKPMKDNAAREYYLCCKDGPIFDFEAIDMEVSPFGY